MDLIVLGHNGPYPSKCGASAGYLLTTESGNIVLDMGSGVFSRLSAFVAPEEVKAVFLSHLHHDHISDLGVYNYYLEYLYNRGRFAQGKMPCYVPEDYGDLSRLREAYVYFDFIPVSLDTELKIGDAHITFERMRHAIPCYGVRVESDGKTFAYSGDSNVCEGLEKLVASADLWLCGAPFIGDNYPPQGGHLSIELASEWAERYAVPTVASHLVPEWEERYKEAVGSRFVSLAEEMKKYHV